MRLPKLSEENEVTAASVIESCSAAWALPTSIRPLSLEMKVWGAALPVRCPGGDNLWIHVALQNITPGEILVIDVGGASDFGYWGEILATSALAKGAGGIIINGGVRDIVQLKKLKLPTFSRCVCIRGTAKDPHGDGAVGQPTQFGGGVVRHGDFILGDADGVVVVPSAMASEAVESAIRREQNEVAIIERVRAGETTFDIFDLKPPKD